MVRLVDEALRNRSLFRKRDGLAAKDVTICDPAVGTGTYLLGVLRQIAMSVEADKGAGAVAAEEEKAASRMFAFEMQFGPFAVAQLRLIAEMQALVGTLIPPIPKLYITDTLGDPYAAETQFSITVAPIAASRKEANRIKREQRITVVIGNPPYKNQAGGRAGCRTTARAVADAVDGERGRLLEDRLSADDQLASGGRGRAAATGVHGGDAAAGGSVGW
jgi:predicted helicase